MIYLIEDKTSRRNDYGWTDEKVSSLNDVITVVENATILIELIPEILNSSNVVLYHESFTKNETYEKGEKVKSFIQSLEETQNIHIAYFSGSKTQRKNEGLICNLNYDPLYTNLDVFIKYYQHGITDFNYLIFGENHEIENRLLQMIQKVNNENVNIATIKSAYKILAYRTSDNSIQFPISNATSIDNCDYDCEDGDFIKLVEEQSNNQYDAIYIPLCMGETLSDFLGLRLAMFYRLCDTVNKFAHLFVYGVENNPSIFLRQECSEVLKMHGVNYIKADGDSIKESIQLIHRINKEEYHLGLNKIHLSVPSNIGDTHSVTNKWGIFRWSSTLEGSDDAIEENNDVIESSLYFKYLSALYPPSEIPHINKNSLKIQKDEIAIETKMPDLNILYVDDEADEGWYELLCQIIYDENGKEFHYIGRQIRSMTKDEIINYVMNTIKCIEANVVILDLRLHPKDFDDNNIKKITGYKLLEAIKHYNRGIQVLMFSATNKIWNLQALQKNECDGFIMKEAPVNSVDKDFTKQSITSFIQSLSDCSRNTYKKTLWEKIQIEKEHILRLRKSKLVNKEYAKAIEVLLTMTEDALFSKDLQYAYATAFMNLFRIIEATANELIDPNVVVEYTESGEPRSYFKFRKDDKQLLEFNNKKFNPSPSKKLVYYKENPSLQYFQKICNTLHVVGAYNLDAYNIVAKRNKFTHPNLIENSEIENFTVKDVLSVFDLVEQLLLNQ